VQFSLKFFSRLPIVKLQVNHSEVSRMRINSGMPADFAVEAGRSTKSGGTTAAHAADSHETAGADTTALSTGQDRVSTLISELRNVPEVRQEKVDALRAAIQRGEHQVAPEQIAAAMYRDMASLTSAGSAAELGVNVGS
jgi:flagellar biosynthesis anti-sigma factor FlgM